MIVGESDQDALYYQIDLDWRVKCSRSISRLFIM